MTNSHQHRADVLQDRFGLAVAAQLNAAASALPHDVTERLRVARQQAVAQRKRLAWKAAPAAVNNGGGTLALGDEGLDLWGRIGAVVPLLALVAGLIFINSLQTDIRADELAEVDTALLTDDLPPAAYADPGFLQFLKAERPPQQ
jgi:Protein of unknown function (DUF3619)